MIVFKVMIWDYDEIDYYIVRCAKDAEDARAQVRVVYEKDYPCMDWDTESVSVEEITLKKGVTRL